MKQSYTIKYRGPETLVVRLDLVDGNTVNYETQNINLQEAFISLNQDEYLATSQVKKVAILERKEGEVLETTRVLEGASVEECNDQAEAMFGAMPQVISFENTSPEEKSA